MKKVNENQTRVMMIFLNFIGQSTTNLGIQLLNEFEILEFDNRQQIVKAVNEINKVLKRNENIDKSIIINFFMELTLSNQIDSPTVFSDFEESLWDNLWEDTSVADCEVLRKNVLIIYQIILKL